MSARHGRRADWWFGKATKLKPGTETGPDEQGRHGKVAETGRWFSHDWWLGRWQMYARNDDGEFAGERGLGWKAKPKTDAGWGGGYQARKTTAASRQAAARSEYDAYLSDRHRAAERATKGYMVSPAGKANGYTGHDFFDPDTRRRPGMRWASDELRAWFGDGQAAGDKGHRGGMKGTRGGLLSFTEYQASTRERAAA